MDDEEWCASKTHELVRMKEGIVKELSNRESFRSELCRKSITCLIHDHNRMEKEWMREMVYGVMMDKVDEDARASCQRLRDMYDTYTGNDQEQDREREDEDGENANQSRLDGALAREFEIYNESLSSYPELMERVKNTLVSLGRLLRTMTRLRDDVIRVLPSPIPLTSAPTQQDMNTPPFPPNVPHDSQIPPCDERQCVVGDFEWIIGSMIIGLQGGISCRWPALQVVLNKMRHVKDEVLAHESATLDDVEDVFSKAFSQKHGPVAQHGECIKDSDASSDADVPAQFPFRYQEACVRSTEARIHARYDWAAVVYFSHPHSISSRSLQQQGGLKRTKM